MMYSQARRVSCARGVTGTAFGGAPNRLIAAHRLADGTTPTAALVPPLELRVETALLIEAAASALGAAGLADEGVRTARAATRELRASHEAGDATRWARLFHQTLLDACPNRHMLDLLERASTCDIAPVPRGVDADVIDRIAADHDALIALIVTDAPQREIERALREHASRSMLCCLVPTDS